MVVNGEHGVGVGELMEMDAYTYVRTGRGTCGPRRNGVVMIISVRTRGRLLVHVDACPCSRSAHQASRASWAPGPSNSRGRTCRARPTRSRSGPHRRCRRWRRRRRGAARYCPGRQRSRELGPAPAPGLRALAARNGAEARLARRQATAAAEAQSRSAATAVAAFLDD